jgi:hypothetical protein
MGRRASLGRVTSTPRRLILALGLAAALAGCGDDESTAPTVPEGPGTVVVESEFLVPFDDACHVQGTMLNTSEVVAFDVSLRFQALDANEKIIGTTRANVGNLLPGERRLYNATGFAANDVGLIPCRDIARFERIQTTITPR